jgi:hypothetical protein
LATCNIADCPSIILIKQGKETGIRAGPVIQATGRSEFKDGLGSGDFVSGYSYHMSVRTRLPDHTLQTKFQSQRPRDVKHLFPLLEYRSAATSGQSVLGWVTALWVCVHCKVPERGARR